MRLKMADRIGQRMGHYRLVRLLGQGGFAEVYLGEHIYLDTQAAIKVLHTQLARDGIEQFRLEAKRIAHLEHPHIVRVLDFGVEGTTPFLVMSYAPGGTLRQRHPKGTQLPLPLIVQYVKQVADALQYAHEEKFIHRDIKPENMLLGRRNEVLLSDFGIATIVHSTTSLSVQAAVGTVPYMAPEQLEEHPRPASDQYALAVVVYEWLSGDRPFDGSFTEIVVKHLTIPPPPLHKRIPAISPEVEQVVMTSLAKDYKQRFASVQAFARALEQASQVTTSPPDPLPRETGSPNQPASQTTPAATNELSQSASSAEVDTPANSPAMPMEAPRSTISSTAPTEKATPMNPSAVPMGMVTPASSATRSIEEIPPTSQLSLPPEIVTSPGIGSPSIVADTAHHTPPILPPPTRELVSPTEPQSPKRGISRRTVVIGLAGLATASAGIAWLVAFRPSSYLASNTSSSGGSTGVNSGGTPAKVTSLDVLTVWSGEDLASFNAINAAFTQKTGIKVNVESTRDLPTVLNTRVRGNNPPDITGSPDLTTFRTLATQGKLLQLDKFFNMSQIQQNYAQAWINLASVNGHLYAVLPKANTKGTIWYSPKQFQANGYTIPATWNDLIALSDKIASSGKYPWSMGVASGAASGWAAADWVDQIYLSLNGPDMSDKWVAHKIPWTHPSVKNAFQMFGQIVTGRHYINGAPQSILATNFQPASFLPFDNPPKAYMYYLGDFTAGFITAQFPSIAAGTDFNFFPFPTINSQFAGAITGGADMMIAMKDNDGTRQFMQFMASVEAQEIWVKRGGATSVNKAVPLSAYPNDVARNSAMQLTQATSFRSSQDDSMPAAMESAYWKATLDFIGDPTKLDSILSRLESTATQVYTS
jgi:alpha-glucoside transport system substrate-binding protein